ncbi:MAG: hypothetical protein JST00_30730 [Deltaproteobacteria bacterium]|nr:hypothetical protein [Deltaproteobacteria bacterium]
MASGPRMPAGMLSPPGDADAKPRSLKLEKGIKSGSWVELQVAEPNDAPTRATFEHYRDDSRFFSLDVLPLLHKSFASALPGFDLFVPRLFVGERLTRLVDELGELEKTLSYVKTAASAREKWGLQSELVRGLATDAEWVAVRDAIAATAREVAAFAKATSEKGRGLWILGV